MPFVALPPLPSPTFPFSHRTPTPAAERKPGAEEEVFKLLTRQEHRWTRQHYGMRYCNVRKACRVWHVSGNLLSPPDPSAEMQKKMLHVTGVILVRLVILALGLQFSASWTQRAITIGRQSCRRPENRITSSERVAKPSPGSLPSLRCLSFDRSWRTSLTATTGFSAN